MKTARELGLRLDRDGCVVVPEVIPPAACDALLAALAPLERHDSRRRGGVRNLLALAPAVRELAGSAPFRAIVDRALSPSAFPVRAILFDKTPDANWHVAWHQDVTIAVSGRIDGLEGYGPWSSKAGVAHVQPPAEVLERMVTLRLHLDPCDERNGALQVIPGSHRGGVADERPPASGARTCPVPRGGVLVMRPLLWHASARAEAPAHRRVVHVEYADCELAWQLEWHEREQSSPHDV